MELFAKILNDFQMLTILRKLLFAGINFHEFRKILTILRKLVPAKINGDCAAPEYAFDEYLISDHAREKDNKKNI